MTSNILSNISFCAVLYTHFDVLEYSTVKILDSILVYTIVCWLIYRCIFKTGTSSVVYPAAGFAPRLAARGVPVAEFNLEETPATGGFRYRLN